MGQINHFCPHLTAAWAVTLPRHNHTKSQAATQSPTQTGLARLLFRLHSAILCAEAEDSGQQWVHM